VQHAHAAGLLNSFALSREPVSPERRRQRFARKNRTLRLIDCQVLNCKVDGATSAEIGRAMKANSDFVMR
jgi:hypothetical protein